LTPSRTDILHYGFDFLPDDAVTLPLDIDDDWLATALEEAFALCL